jgi:lipoprotein-anchoring transpeptidase ErfK/SrfK
MLTRATLAVLVAVTLVLATAPAQAGPSERRAQQRLNELGCDSGRADGRIDPRTRSAVVRFQAANGLTQSGKLTRPTRSRLFADRQVRCDRRPVVASGQGRRVVVSQRQNYVWLVRADGSVAAQGGLVDNPRVLSPGSYTVGSKCGRPAKIRRNSDYSGRLWLEYFTRFAPCGVGFHRIPVQKSDGRQIHADWMLGTNFKESSGCIRLSRRMAARMWDFAGVGTRVVVR